MQFCKPHTQGWDTHLVSLGSMMLDRTPINVGSGVLQVSISSMDLDGHQICPPKYWWYSNKGYTILYACLIWASKPMFIIFCLLFDIVSGWCYLYLLTWSRTLIFRTFCLPMILNMGCGRIVHLLSVIVPIHGTLAISACKLTWQSDFSRNVSFWSKEFLPVKLSLKSIDLWFMLTFLSSMLSKVFEMQFLRFI